MEAKRSLIVTEYMRLRCLGGQSKIILDLMSKDAVLVDKDGKEHKGEKELIAYFNIPGYNTAKYGIPESIPDNRFKIDLYITLGIITFTYKIYFSFGSADNLIYRVEVKKE
jgi:hypothetical protein